MHYFNLSVCFVVFSSAKEMECKIFLGDLHESIRRGFVMLVRSYFNHTNRSIWRTMVTCYRWERVEYILCLFRSVINSSLLCFIKVTSSSMTEIHKIISIYQILVRVKHCLCLAYVLSKKAFLISSIPYMKWWFTELWCPLVFFCTFRVAHLCLVFCFL